MKLLVAVDLSDSTQIVVEKAEEIAKALSAEVWLLHNAEPAPDALEFRADPQTAREDLAERFHHKHSQIQEIARRFREAGLKATALLVHGAMVETILKEASKLDVDMIVVGAHGRSAMYKVLVGSVSDGVLYKSKCPITIIPTHQRT